MNNERKNNILHCRHMVVKDVHTINYDMYTHARNMANIIRLNEITSLHLITTSTPRLDRDTRDDYNLLHYLLPIIPNVLELDLSHNTVSHMAWGLFLNEGVVGGDYLHTIRWDNIQSKSCFWLNGSQLVQFKKKN